MKWRIRKGWNPGLISSFFSEADPRSAREQLHSNYAHGGGVSPFPGFSLHFDPEAPSASLLTYPGDPPLLLQGFTKLRKETILVFAYDWVVILQPDGSFIATRCD